MSFNERRLYTLSSSAQECKQEKYSKEREEECPIAGEVTVTNAHSSNEKASNKRYEDCEFKEDSLNRKCLKSCLTFLCDNLTVEEVINHLEENEILTRNETHKIFAKKTPHKKNDKLIEFVQQRGPEAFRCFMKSLTKTGQKYIFDKLIEERKNLRFSTSSSVCSSIIHLASIQSSLRRIYSKSYRSVIPVFSAPFFFDIKDKWVNLTLRLENNSTLTEDYADLLKKAFDKADMMIIEGDPGIGKSSFMHRLAYEWTQSRLSDYDLVLYIEFRKLRDYMFEDIEELIVHYMNVTLDKQAYKIFHHFKNYTECCREHKILVLLDGYDESALEEQCHELSDYFYSTISSPLWFNVIITSRKGYLSKLRNQGRFIFADIIGFTTVTQKQEYISKHFNATNDTELPETIADVTNLLNTNENLKRLSESPLMMTFICLLHKKIIDGTEVELYMNIIWWMIDRYQKSNPNLDVPSIFKFVHDASDKFRVIEKNYHQFPQLHLLGTMAMQDIFKTTFTEADLINYQLNDILQQVGFLRKEIIRDTSYHTKTEFSFVHRTVQEFVMALTFFFSNEVPPKDFLWYVFFTARNKGYGVIQAKIQKFLKMIFSSKININESKKTLYIMSMKIFSQVYSYDSPLVEHTWLSEKNSQEDVIHNIAIEGNIPQSSEEAIQWLHDEAEHGDAFAQYSLGLMYDFGLITIQSDEKAAKWYTESAKQGNAYAQYVLGVMCDYGRGLPQSDEKALQRYIKSAEQGNADAQCRLGFIYEKGKGVPQSDEEAVKWYRKSAEQGNTDAQFNLGNMYSSGKGMLQSDEEAVKWYSKSAEQGNADAQFNLGIIYENGKGVPQSYEEAVKWFTKSAEQGNANALFNLGIMYANGIGVPQSDEEAVKWYRKSAEQGNVDAQCNLGLMYKYGKGSPQSDEEAAKWFTKSAEQGNADAQCNLGLTYRYGKGVPHSNERALKWYRKAAEQGNADAQCNLGIMHANGIGVPQSDQEAVKWYRKSAEQGNAIAQYALGVMYDYGRGLPQSDEEALKWYTKSAVQGHARAQFNLGNMYWSGKGMPQSDEEAVKWYTKSAEQGNEAAQFNLRFMRIPYDIMQLRSTLALALILVLLYYFFR